MSASKGHKLHFGAIGCGAIVEKSFLPAIHANPRAVLLGATRKDTGRVASFCKAHGIERPYSSFEELLADPDIDVVYVATPVAFHVDQIVAAAEHSKHVLCEKPLGLNREETARALSACSEKGVKLSVAYYRRRFPEIGFIQSLLRKEALGTLLAVRFFHGTWYSPEPDADASWRLSPTLGGGGALMDVGSHRLDLIHFLCGRGRRAFCRLSHQVHDHWRVEAGATALLELVEGAEGQVSVCFNQKERTDSLWMYGSRANLHCPRLGEGKLILYEDGREETVHLDPTPKSRTHVPVIESILGELLDGADNPFTAEHVMVTEETLDACYRSAKEGRWVELMAGPDS